MVNKLIAAALVIASTVVLSTGPAQARAILAGQGIVVVH